MKIIMVNNAITSLENVKQVSVVNDTIRVDYCGNDRMNCAFIHPNKKEINNTLVTIYEILKRQLTNYKPYDIIHNVRSSEAT